MMRVIANAMRLQAQRALASVVSSRIGQIKSYDPSTFTARVQLQPDSIMTGWLPVASPWIGNGWGLFAAPNIDDMVAVEYINGDLEAGTVVGRFWNLEDLPLPVPSGEFWLVHKKGASFKLKNDGSLTIDDGKGASVELDGAGNIKSTGSWKHTGTIDVTGAATFESNATFDKDVQVNQTLTATTDVIGGGISLKNHTHTSASPGSPTSPPLP